MMERPATPAQPIHGLAIVAIGRNEGERLHRCLLSALPHAGCVVYVDSGSTDGSAAWARQHGATVVDLDLSTPFTAARARNAGWRKALELNAALQWVQFVDGDCELQPGWLGTAVALLTADDQLAVVCGRRRERHPEASVYNRLCDWEWNTPVGPAKACGGDALFRVEALRGSGGYRDTLIAGEEPELCVRLRAQGWQIFRADCEMTLHDAALTRFGQWWRRSRRAGYAYAEGAHLHGAPPERHWVQETRRALLWGAVLPVGLLVLTVGCLAMRQQGVAALAWLILPVQWGRLLAKGTGTLRDRLIQATFLLVGKLPEALGVVQSVTHRWLNKRTALIEYK